jgi:copper transport protein
VTFRLLPRTGPASGRGGRPALLALAAALLALLVLALPAPAQAHARPVSSDPADGQVLDTAPRTLRVTFDEPVSPAAAGNRLLNADGHPIEAAFTVQDRVLSITPAVELAGGTHVVTWRVVSADGHPISGGLTFSIGAPSATTVGLPGSAEQREVQLVRTLATGAGYLGVLGIAGLTVLAVLIAPVSIRDNRSIRAAWCRTATGLALVAASGAILLVPVAALWETGASWSAILTGSTWSAAMNGSTVIQSLAIVAGVTGAAVGLRRRRDTLAVSSAALALASLVVVGHTRSYGPAAVVLAADLIHLAAGAIWWGGLIGLALALAIRPAPPSKGRAQLIARFSTVAALGVALLVPAGLTLYLQVAHSFRGLWETAYGRAVVAKSALVLPVLALAWWNRSRLVPRATSLTEGAASRLLLRTVSTEAAILAGVIAVSALLVNLSPPARGSAEAPTAAIRTLEIEVDAQHSATVVMTPARRGVNGVRVQVRDERGSAVDLKDPPTLSFLLPDASVGPLQRPVSRAADGVWEATVDLPLSGRWEVAVAVPLSDFDEPVVSAEVEVR